MHSAPLASSPPYRGVVGRSHGGGEQDGRMAEPFALLLTVYGGARAAHVREAFRSAVAAQTRRPAQVILVQDGPVSADLADCLAELTKESPVPVTFLPLEHNGGLGLA